MSEEQSVNIDGKDYPIADLSEDSRAKLMSLRIVDQELARLQQQIAIAQTARIAYGKALNKSLGIDSNTPPPASEEELAFNFS